MRLARTLLLALVTGCASQPGAEPGATCAPAADPSTVPDFTAPLGLVEYTVVPSDLDPLTDHNPGAHHRILVPDDPAVMARDELFLMLPGSGDDTEELDGLATIAARAGYPVVVLGYSSEATLEEICADLDLEGLAALVACRYESVNEIVFGTDTQRRIDLDEADGIAGRLERLLRAGDAVAPALDAARFLDGDEIRWDKVVVAGFSQGSTMAGYLSIHEELARAVLLTGGCDGLIIENGSVLLNAWCTRPRATPPERTWAMYHLMDTPDIDGAVMDAYGLSALGAPAHAPTDAPPYCDHTHVLQTDLPAAGRFPGQYHRSVAVDGYLPVDEGGVPLLAEDYHYLFTAE